MTSNWQALPSYQPQNTECDWLYGHWPFAFEMKNEKKQYERQIEFSNFYEHSVHSPFTQ